MNHLVIGIPTYKRPLMLKKLIESIYACDFDRDLIGKIDLVVVDNDIEKTAKQTCMEFNTHNRDGFKFHYHSYPKKGLTNVRNEILSRALSLEPKYIIFIDDDEYVTKDWLNQLVGTIISTNGDFVLGPVIPVFDHKAPSSIANWFWRPEFPDKHGV